MKDLIENFPLQLKDALVIGASYKFTSEQRNFKSIVICGLGGSGIGGSFAKDATFNELKVPMTLVKGYFLPKFVDEDTLVIVSSNSGNTEETIFCLKEAISKKAGIVGITSNGEVLDICKSNNYDCIQIPGGHPPRACFGYSSLQLFYILHHFKLIDAQFKADFDATILLLKEEQTAIKKIAFNLAESLFDKMPVLYSADQMESITIRWRQQINENGKQLCWHHVIPEMNHNELVGWRDKNENLAVVYLRNESDFTKIQQRMDLNQKVIKTFTSSVFEVLSKGASFIEISMYLLHVGDWMSFYLADLRGYNVLEVNVIDELKANLK